MTGPFDRGPNSESARMPGGTTAGQIFRNRQGTTVAF